MTRQILSPPPAEQHRPQIPATRSETGQLDDPLDDADAVTPVAVHEVLEPGEALILAIKPSPWFILLESLPTLAGLALLVAILIALAQQGYLGLANYQRDLIFAGIGLSGVRLFYQLVDWLARMYILTDRRVITLSGPVNPTVTETPLKDIQAANLCATFRERLIGLGTILFRGSNNARLMRTAWRSLARPNEVHEVVNQTIKRYR